ncbi:hypothetical protein [Maricaulis sp.]|uniref:hypothetical protein n=1 Tax=Maricaulis sp. TaxID=1486257 RepID=UPI003298723B
MTPRPAMIETPGGTVCVAGADEGASCAVYTDDTKAAEALKKAQDGCIAVLKRYGLFGLVVCGARAGDGRDTTISAAVHGDSQFIGTALLRLETLPGWTEAAAFEAAAKKEGRA